MQITTVTSTTEYEQAINNFLTTFKELAANNLYSTTSPLEDICNFIIQKIHDDCSEATIYNDLTDRLQQNIDGSIIVNKDFLIVDNYSAYEKYLKNIESVEANLKVLVHYLIRDMNYLISVASNLLSNKYSSGSLSLCEVEFSGDVMKIRMYPHG